LQLVVMTDVPTSSYRTAVGVEQIGFPDPWSGFQLLDSQLGQFPSRPSYLGAVGATASVGLDWSGP
jgi:hypothetical protein